MHFWQPQQGLNLQPPGSEPGTLPIELYGYSGEINFFIFAYDGDITSILGNLILRRSTNGNLH